MSKLPIAIALAGLLAATPVSSKSLTAEARSALDAALQDERHAEAVYDAVLRKFGDVRPFSNIIVAERRHQAMLINIYKAYCISVPGNGYATGEIAAPVAPATLGEACKFGIDAEIANRDLYDRTLLPAVVAYPDINQIMQRLRDASEENHLPAFRRCANRG